MSDAHVPAVSLGPSARRGPARSLRRAALGLGALGLVLSLGLVPLLGCSCDPAPAPPSTETCAAVPGLVATSVRVFRHGGDELVDGSVPPQFFGAQGGSHWGFDLLVTAEGAGDCVDVSLEAHENSPTGALLGSFEGGVRARLVTGGVRTAQIVILPAFPTGRPVVVTARAYGAVATITLCTDGSSCVPDAGPGRDAP